MFTNRKKSVISIEYGLVRNIFVWKRSKKNEMNIWILKQTPQEKYTSINPYRSATGTKVSFLYRVYCESGIR